MSAPAPVSSAEIGMRIEEARASGDLPRCGCCGGDPHGIGLVAHVLRKGETAVCIEWRSRPAFG